MIARMRNQNHGALEWEPHLPAMSCQYRFVLLLNRDVMKIKASLAAHNYRYVLVGLLGIHKSLTWIQTSGRTARLFPFVQRDHMRESFPVVVVVLKSAPEHGVDKSTLKMLDAQRQVNPRHPRFHL
jgi:hypothetical protein